MENKPKISEVVWWAIAIGIVIGFGVNFVAGYSGYDWFVYYYPQAIKMDITKILNPLWIYFILGPIAHLPLTMSFVVFLLINIMIFRIGLKLSGGKHFLLLFSFPTLWILWYGQLDGFVLLGVVLGLVALRLEKPYVMGFAILLLLVKPHIGGPLAILYFVWQKNYKTMIPILIVLFVSMVVWSWEWPIAWLKNFTTMRVEQYTTQSTNISLYPYGILAWLAIFVPKSYSNRVKIALSATLLSVPYAATYSILPLLVFPLPWWIYGLSSIPLLLGPDGYRFTMIVPIATILVVLYSERISTRQGVLAT